MTKSRWSNIKISKFLETYEKYDILWNNEGDHLLRRHFISVHASSNLKSNLKVTETTQPKLAVKLLEFKRLEVK